MTADDKGVAFVGCDGKTTGAAQTQGRRREVMVSGKRVRTVDIHAHCAVPEAKATPERCCQAPRQLPACRLDPRPEAAAALPAAAPWDLSARGCGRRRRYPQPGSPVGPGRGDHSTS